MGRHAEGKHSGKKRRTRPLPILFGVVGLVVVIVLGVWWWGLRDATDPIDADPQRAYAVVVSSQPCTQPAADTTVEFQVAGQTVTAALGGCGFKVDQRLAIQYLNGHPEQVRLVGVTATPASSTAKRVLPIIILAIGFIAVVAALALIREKRQGRRRAAGSGGSAMTVQEMQAAVAAARPSTEPAESGEDAAAGPGTASPYAPVVVIPPPSPDQPDDLFTPKAGQG
ncbi:hypothetical protein D1871_08965 [Nakamurella silvestris]|nr:hypothetical protein D1871_08965 [Nakamurella silvestris]